jgi:hypothetical protein
MSVVQPFRKQRWFQRSMGTEPNTLAEEEYITLSTTASSLKEVLQIMWPQDTTLQHLELGPTVFHHKSNS